VASQVAKPDGLVVVESSRESEFLAPLPVELIWGVGPVTRARLAGAGILTVGDLATTPNHVLHGLLGRAAAATLAARAVNIDPRRIETARRAASMGAQAALGRRHPTDELLAATFGYLADRVAGRLRAAGRAGRTITIKVRFAGLRTVTRALTLGAPVSTTLTLAEAAADLAREALADNPGERHISLLAISVSNLIDEPALQLALPLRVGGDRYRPGTPLGAARWATDRSVDAIRARFGRGAVGYATVMFSDVGRVPDAFRELAERSGEVHSGRGPTPGGLATPIYGSEGPVDT
jgi:DNA polymerase-4